MSIGLTQPGPACTGGGPGFSLPHGCLEPTRDIDDYECPWCNLTRYSTTPPADEYGTGLTHHDLLLFLSYGLSAGLADDIAATIWRTSAGNSEPVSRWDFATLWHATRFQEHERRTDLVPYFETVLPADQRAGVATCSDCEFRLSMGLVWGYRWSTLSGRVSTDTTAVNHQDPPDYGFRFLHQASPKWRYVLALDRVSDTLDVVGEALWQIRPDAYVSLSTDLAEFDLLTQPVSDLKLHFSFD